MGYIEEVSLELKEHPSTKDPEGFLAWGGILLEV